MISGELTRQATEVIQKLTAENSALKKRVKELDEECEAKQYQFDILKKDPACVWANMLRGNIATPSALVEAHDYQQIKAENANLRAKLEKEEFEGGRLEDACAELKSFVRELWRVAGDDTDISQANINDVLSTSCGTGWRSPEDYAALEAILKLEEEHRLAVESVRDGLEAKVKVLGESLSAIMQLIDNGVLVRDTELDSHTNWAIAQLPLVKALAQANEALSETGGEK